MVERTVNIEQILASVLLGGPLLREFGVFVADGGEVRLLELLLVEVQHFFTVPVKAAITTLRLGKLVAHNDISLDALG